MRVVLFSDYFYPHVNGIASYVENFAEGLAKEGNDVLVVAADSRRSNGDSFKRDGVEVVYVPAFKTDLHPEIKLSFVGLPRFFDKVRRFDPDVIHFNTPGSLGMDAVGCAKLLKKPLVGTIHTYLTNYEYLRSFIKFDAVYPLVGELLIKYCKFLYDKCDLVLCPSLQLIADLDLHKFGIDIEYLPNPTRVVGLKKLGILERNKWREKLGLKQKVILHCGRLSGDKNISLLIKIFSLITLKDKHVSLLIIGDGPERKNLEKLTIELGISESVVFTGFIKHDKLIEEGWIGLGDMFLTTSLTENNPMVVLESMAYGLPIGAVNKGGMGELIGGNGFLVEDGEEKKMVDEVVRVLGNTKVRNKMSLESLKVAQKFSQEHLTLELLKRYDRVVDKFKNVKKNKRRSIINISDLIKKLNIDIAG